MLPGGTWTTRWRTRTPIDSHPSAGVMRQFARQIDEHAECQSGTHIGAQEVPPGRRGLLRRLEDPLQFFEGGPSFGDEAQAVLLQGGHLVFLHLRANGCGVGLAGQ